jgi:hypothetical protein
VESFENGDFVSEFGKVAGACESGRTGTDDGDFVSVGRSGNGLLITVISVPVSYETLKTADSNRLAFDAAYALGFALSFLRTYTAADSGKGRGLMDDLIGTLEIAFLDFLNEFGDMDVNGATVNTGHVLAVQAALRFIESYLFCVTDSDLMEVVSTYQGIL